MLKKRLVGVITVKDGWAVQSFGYRRHLPLGHPEWLAENLDRWGADEILILDINRTRNGQGPDLALLRRLGNLGLATPLVYGGGIGDAADAVAVIQAGADRVCLDALLHRDLTAVERISAALGAQALIASLPVSVGPAAYDYQEKRHPPLSPDVLRLLEDGVVSEALLIDWQNEGGIAAFDERLIDEFPRDGVPLIAFGGITEPAQIARLVASPRIIAVAVGNSLNYREHAMQSLRQALDSATVRPAEYA